MKQRRIPVYCVYQGHAHPSLALGMIVSYAKVHNGGALNDVYEFIPGLLRSVDEARDAVTTYGPGIFLCSSYIWSHRENLEIARSVKAWHSDSLVIFGGPSVPKYEATCQAFFDQHPFVDIAVRGEGELTMADLLEQWAAHVIDRTGAVGGDLASPRSGDRRCLEAVQGITFRVSGGGPGAHLCRTADRARIVDVNILPSPYLTGWFQSSEAATWVSAIMETNRGCPYGCAFCDWGSATLSKVRQFSLDRVKDELRWLARHGVNGLWIADANFGIFKRDIEIAQEIAECRKEHNVPRHVIVNYAKQGSDRAADIVGILQNSGVAADGIISIQTQDVETLKIIRRSNIKTDHYDKLIGVFRRRNLPVSSDLMIGLPGATPEAFKSDLQFFFDRGVYAKAYQTVVLPNSPMADPEYLRQYEIKTDAKGNIISTFSYTRLDLFAMNQTYFYYKIMVGYAILKYVLYYLQYDHGIPALTFLDDLQKAVNERPKSLPRTSALMHGLILVAERRRVLSRQSQDDWAAWHREIAGFLAEKYGVSGPALDAVLALQSKVLPGLDRALPEKVESPFDIAAYLKASRERPEPANPQRHGRLDSFGPAVLEVSDPRGLCDLAYVNTPPLEDHHIDWELNSDLGRSWTGDELLGMSEAKAS